MATTYSSISSCSGDREPLRRPRCLLPAVKTNSSTEFLMVTPGGADVALEAPLL
jgi:hypothetical protein